MTRIIQASPGPQPSVPNYLGHQALSCRGHCRETVADSLGEGHWAARNHKDVVAAEGSVGLCSTWENLVLVTLALRLCLFLNFTLTTHLLSLFSYGGCPALGKQHGFLSPELCTCCSLYLGLPQGPSPRPLPE